MNALLDTHVFLWWITDDNRLSSEVRKFIENGENQIFFSAASGWEIAIKSGLGKLSLPTGDLAMFIEDQLRVNAFNSLPVQVNHALYVTHLPLIHRDPFDRMLVAQAMTEEMPIITSDNWLRQYHIEVIW